MTSWLTKLKRWRFVLILSSLTNAQVNAHMMMKTFLPNQNQFPSGYQDIRQMKRSFSEEVRVVKNSPRQSLCITGFRYQLRDIIQQNISEIFDYSEYRKKNIHSEFNCVLRPPLEVKQNREFFIYLILFSEGVNNKKSTLRKQLWPVCLQIADLPPRRRNSRQNIVLAALFVGFTIPNWADIVPLLNAELLSSVQHRFNGFFF